MDFDVGMRVHKSNNHPTEDICDVLTGDYPKTVKFSSMASAVPLLRHVYTLHKRRDDADAT